MHANQMVFALQSNASNHPLEVTIVVSDPDVLQEICARAEGAERDRFLAQALRIGVLSLRMASGQVDGATMRAAGEQLMSDLRSLLEQRAGDVQRGMAETLRSYFDPESGLVSQRLRSLVERDGDLSRVLSAHVGGNESQLARTLASHLGQESPLFRMLSPSAAEGLKVQLEKSVETVLVQQRDKILSEFSLDKQDSALRRLVTELETRHKELRTDLGGQVDEIIKEFSLDHENSALSRLVGRVEQAQRTVTSEFSLDREDSAMSRIVRQLAEMTEKISVLTTQRQEAARSPRGGLLFEDALAQVLQDFAQRQADVFERTGATTGTIRHCKVGDFTIEMGPDSPAAGARIVWEAKEDGKYDLKRAREEIELARKNRGAGIGVFVFSQKHAPAGMDVFSRYGDDLILVWDPDSPASEVTLKAAYSTARALSLRAHRQKDESEDALAHIERATRGVEKQIRFLEDIRRQAETAKNSGAKILERADRMVADLQGEVELLDEQLAALRSQPAGG